MKPGVLIMKPFRILACAAAAFLIAPLAYADKGNDVGVLTCKLTDVTNVIVYTDEKFDCVFKPKSGADYSYAGQIKSIGIDLSITKDMTLVWAVITSTTEGDVADQMRGDYVGAGADVEVGGGVGLNALVGGSSRAITLQPVSVSGSIGAGASLGIESFTLR